MIISYSVKASYSEEDRSTWDFCHQAITIIAWVCGEVEDVRVGLSKTSMDILCDFTILLAEAVAGFCCYVKFHVEAYLFEEKVEARRKNPATASTG